MSFLDKAGLQTLTNKLVQGDAIKVASHRGHTVKNVIDNIQRECDNVANPLEYKMENRVADFKIGKGRDVDVSGDVENGYTEVELQGKTYQNLYIKDIFNGDISNWSALTSEQYSFSDGYLTLTANGGYVNAFEKISTLMVKPNTKYTAIFDIKENTLSTERKNNFTLVSGTTSAISDTSMFLPPKKTGLYPVSFTTKSDLSACSVGLRSFIYTGTMSGKITFNYILLEGDHTQTPIEELPQYFEGIKSSFEDGIVDVEVVGKNLFDGELEYGYIDSTTGTSNPNIRYDRKRSKNFISVSPNSILKYSTNIGEKSINWFTYDKNKKFIGRLNFSNSIIVPSNCYYIRYHNGIPENEPLYNIKDQIEAHNNQTSYEPYYKKKISFNIGEPLRSLPNGVCDEIRNNNGQWELVRKVGKVILNGSESWSQYDSQELENSRYYFLNFNGVKSNNILCNILPTNSPDAGGMWDRDIEGIAYKIGNGCFRLRLSKTKANSLKDFKIWLSQNLATVYYELETPIITPIEPIEFEIKPLGSININSDISPVSYHTVQLNRAGQIERAICNIAELKNRVEALETIYDSHFLETQHKLSLLEMDYELEGGSV